MDHWGCIFLAEKGKKSPSWEIWKNENGKKEERKYRWRDEIYQWGGTENQTQMIVNLQQYFTWKCFILAWVFLLLCRLSNYFGDIPFFISDSWTTMQHICLSLLFSLCLQLLLLCNAEEGLEFPNFDGNDRVLDINERNYKKALKRYDLLCLFYHEPIPANKGLQKRFQMTELVLEVSTDTAEYDKQADFVE